MEIPIKNIFYLLSYAWNKLEEADKLEISLADYDDALNLLSRILVSGSNHILKKGLDKSYRSVTEEYPGIKGKIDFKASLTKNLFKQGKAVCTFDEFSSNVLHNQILKSVLRRLTKVDAIDAKMKKDIWDCYYRFAGVDEIEVQLNHFSKTKIHRNNYEYDFLLKVAKLIIENSVLNEEEGKYYFKDFVRNEKAMAALFESFVKNFYAKEQSKYKVRREDIQWFAEPLLESNLELLPKMQTDITLEALNHKIIIDTKYYKETLVTNYEKERFHSNNLYQIYAYVSNIEKNSSNPNNINCEGMLLYPTVQKEVNATYQMGNHKMRIATVDLSKNWREIHSRLLEIISA